MARNSETRGFETIADDVGIAETTPLAELSSRLQLFTHPRELPSLDRFIKGTRYFETDQPAWAERGDLAHVCVVESGWAYKFCFYPDGRRHIPDFFGPGAICNWSRLDSFAEQDDILFKAGTRITLIDRQALAHAIVQEPSLVWPITRHELARTMRITQRVRAFISLSTEEKLLLLMLDIASELAPRRHWGAWYRMPFLQSELGDCLGVTPVHISRTFSRLQRRKLVERNGDHFRLCNPESVVQMLSYRDFFWEKTRR